MSQPSLRRRPATITSPTLWIDTATASKGDTTDAAIASSATLGMTGMTGIESLVIDTGVDVAIPDRVGARPRVTVRIMRSMPDAMGASGAIAIIAISTDLTIEMDPGAEA